VSCDAAWAACCLKRYSFTGAVARAGGRRVPDQEPQRKRDGARAARRRSSPLTRAWRPCAQVMEEGERLSKKQLAQENRIRELRAAAEEARGAAARAEAAAAAERQKARAHAPDQAGARGAARRPRALGSATRATAPDADGGRSRPGKRLTRGGAGRRRRPLRRRAPRRRRTARACARATAWSWTPSARPRRPRCSARARRRRGAPCAAPTGLQAAPSRRELGDRTPGRAGGPESNPQGRGAARAVGGYMEPRAALPWDSSVSAWLGPGAGAGAQRPAAPVMQRAC